MSTEPSFILLGADGHAKVPRALAHALPLPMKGVCAAELPTLLPSSWQSIPVLGGDDALKRYSSTISLKEDLAKTPAVHRLTPLYAAS